MHVIINLNLVAKFTTNLIQRQLQDICPTCNWEVHQPLAPTLWWLVVCCLFIIKDWNLQNATQNGQVALPNGQVGMELKYEILPSRPSHLINAVPSRPRFSIKLFDPHKVSDNTFFLQCTIMSKYLLLTLSDN